MFYLFILWLVIMCTLALDWYRHQTWRRGDIGFFSGSDMVFDDSIWIAVGNILSILVMILADTLLVSHQSYQYRRFWLNLMIFCLDGQIYRCYIICGGKKWFLRVFGFFIFADIGELLIYSLSTLIWY